MLLEEHDGYPRNLAYPSLQVGIARGDNIALVLPDALADAVVGVRAWMRARQPHEPRILRHPQRNPVFLSEFFQLCHHAIGDVRDTLRVQAVHHPLHQVNLILDGEVDEVGVHENVVRWTERGVVLEEQGR